MLGLTRDTKTQEKAGLLGSQVISQLKLNESKTFQWDQKDIDGKQLQPGTYAARTSVSSNSSNVPSSYDMLDNSRRPLTSTYYLAIDVPSLS